MADALLEEIREHRTFATNEWDDIRKEAKKDRLCVAGKPWEALDPEGVRERKEAKRPFLSLDELGQYINQTVNDVRANPRGTKFAPTGNGANDAGAEFYQNHVREIEYRSHARIADATAFENAVTGGYGWLRIKTKREHIRTFNQDLWIEPIVNPDQVLSDPMATWPDSRDMKFLYYLEPWTKAAFASKFPRAKIRDFSAEIQRLAPGWVTRDTVVVGEYWKILSVARRLIAFHDPKTGQIQTALLDELPDGKLPAGVENLREESVDDTRVKMYLTNGLEILKEQDWKGKHIPFVSCFGKILYVDEGTGSTRQILSMTRLARDPYMLYCYIRTCEAEAIGGVPRATWVGYEGQFAKPDRWQMANRKPVAFLEGKATTPGGGANILPLPHKEPWDPPLQNLEIAAEAARRAIQAAMGISPLPTPMQKDNQKSGKALERIESSGQRGSFHFRDHYELMLERRGVILEDLMDKTLDTARDVAVRKQDDSAMTVRINDPSAPDPIFTKGDYRVTISTGPADDSQRAAAEDFVDTMTSNLGTIAQLTSPATAAQLLAKSVKLKQLGPIGDEIVDLLAPQMKGKDGKPMPPELQAAMQQVQTLQKQLQQATEMLKGRQVEKQEELKGKMAIVQVQEAAESDRAAKDRAVKLDVAAIQAKLETMAMLLEELQRVGGLEADAAQRLHDAGEAHADRAHQALENVKDRRHEHLIAEASHAHALDLGQQAADLAPEPPAPAG